MSSSINKILIANRGEIAVRIIRACRDMDIRAVAVFSDADATAYHVRLADEAYHIGPSASSKSYLVIDKIIKTALKCGADAVHPGYGFLAENSEFAQRVTEAGLIFIGPKAETITLLGDKLQAREAALAANLPVVPGAELEGPDDAQALSKANTVGFPVLIKAAAGGGGKGMRVVHEADQFEQALKSASSEAASAFGDGRVFVEKYLQRSRHIEIQIMCDSHGNYLHLGERECSIQRRHQKLIEESPSPIVTEHLRNKMGQAAVSFARKTGYVGAGTVEFMYDETHGSFYFLEVNTRLQVEHPVTELVTGLDLVQLQIAIAQGEKLKFKQDDLKLNGHAIEFRICAESPSQNFMPSTGQLRNYRIPAGPGVRVDSGVVLNSEIPIYYDPLIAKLIVWGADRDEAIRRARRALDEYRVAGVETTIGFHRQVMDNENFIKGNLSTSFLEEEYPEGEYSLLSEQAKETAAVAAALHKFITERKIKVHKVKSDSGRTAWSTFYRRDNLQRLKGSD